MFFAFKIFLVASISLKHNCKAQKSVILNQASTDRYFMDDFERKTTIVIFSDDFLLSIYLNLANDLLIFLTYGSK